MYPKVKVRQEAYQEDDDGDVRDLGLKAFISLSLQGSTSPGNSNLPVYNHHLLLILYFSSNFFYFWF